MNNGTRRGPRLCKHKRSGRGYAKFNGRQIWFGPFDDPATHVEFARYKAEWLAAGRRSDGVTQDGVLVGDLVASYLVHAAAYYRKPDGTPTHEIVNVRYTAKPLLELYATLPVEEFTIRQLKAVRQRMVDGGLARRTVNQRVARVVRIFAWGAQEQLLRAEVWGGLKALRPLQAGRSEAHETPPVEPVDWKDVEAVLEHLAAPVRGLVLLQWYTGMRPGEATQLCPTDIDQSGSVWIYTPRRHKLEHRGKSRVVPLGPRAQEVLSPFLLRVPRRDPSKPIFSPREASESCRRSRGTRAPGERYDRSSYRRAIARACDAAGVDRWTPNQLRHAAATRIRAEYGIDAARVILGHSSAETTEIYAEMDHQKALQVAEEVG